MCFHQEKLYHEVGLQDFVVSSLSINLIFLLINQSYIMVKFQLQHHDESFNLKYPS